MRRALTILTALALASLVACGASDARTPQEQADALAAGILAKYHAVFEAMGGDMTATFDPAKNCNDIGTPLSAEAKGTIALFFGQALTDNGTDVTTFANDLEAYRKAIIATGVCK